jgi:hypothetical protein
MYGDLLVADDAIAVLDTPVIARLAEVADRRFERMVIDRHDANGEMLRRFSTNPSSPTCSPSWAHGEAFRQDPRRVG